MWATLVLLLSTANTQGGAKFASVRATWLAATSSVHIPANSTKLRSTRHTCLSDVMLLTAVSRCLRLRRSGLKPYLGTSSASFVAGERNAAARVRQCARARWVPESDSNLWELWQLPKL